MTLVTTTPFKIVPYEELGFFTTSVMSTQPVTTGSAGPSTTTFFEGSIDDISLLPVTTGSAGPSTTTFFEGSIDDISLLPVTTGSSPNV